MLAWSEILASYNLKCSCKIKIGKKIIVQNYKYIYMYVCMYVCMYVYKTLEEMAWRGKGGDSAGCSINRVRLEHTTESQARKLLIPKVWVSVMSDSREPMDSSLPGSSCPWDSPGKKTGVGCHSLLQEIFLTWGSNPGLFHCRQILYHLSHQGSSY